jgi:5-methylthioadenosine/S-adenosylhomocysteine deaminase
MRASYSFAMRDQNRIIYAADEDFVASLPAALRGPVAGYLAGFALPLADQIAVFHALRGRWSGAPLIGIQIAPSNLHWLSDAALESAARMAAETGAPMHMHLLETPYQAEYARRRTGGSALAYIDRFGLVGPQLTIGHGVWMTPDDIALLAERGGCLCHNCSSNLRLKSGDGRSQRLSFERRARRPWHRRGRDQRRPRHASGNASRTHAASWPRA